MRGEVVKLDRKYPLVQCEDGSRFRCEETASIKKKSDVRCVIGDVVEVSPPGNHEFGIIEKIMPRETSFVRKDPADRSASQVLASNFSQVVIIEPFDRLNIKRIERELVLAHETGAKVAILLSKYDTVSPEDQKALIEKVEEIAGPDVAVCDVSIKEPDSILRLKDELFLDETSILLGQSGAGKSSLTNMLTGEETQATGDVRAGDSKGRHTTVNRAIIELSAQDGHTCRIVDMPGVRGLGLWDAQNGIENAFADIADVAQDCKFRDCTHTNEPGCAVKEAVEDGRIAQARLQSYLDLRNEIKTTLERRERASWKNK